MKSECSGQRICSSSEHDTRLDRILSQWTEFSRSQIAKAIASGSVSINGKPIGKPSFKVGEGDQVSWHFQTGETLDLTPWSFPLEVVFEDEDLIVINKPAGVVVHPSAGHSEKTLVHALLHHCKSLAIGFNEHRPGIVHRLDKDTSGLLVVAKSNAALTGLASQFKERTIDRLYQAIVYGELGKEDGEIESYLIRHPNDRKKFTSIRDSRKKILLSEDSSGKYAKTHFRLISRKAELSQLELKLFTGRTHQIRVHMSEMGHPIVGDKIYGRNKKDSFKELDRIALHACRLGFLHPLSGKDHSFEVPWPDDLRTVSNKMGSDFHER